MLIRTTSYRNHKGNSYIILKSPSIPLTGYKFRATFFEKKVHCSQVSNSKKKNRLDHESFYHCNIGRLLYLTPEDCKNELKKLNLTPNKSTNRKFVKFQVFPDSVHQAEFKNTKVIYE